MTYDRKVYRASQDAIGAPGDPAATNSTDDNTQISLLKGLYEVLAETGITVTGGTLATAAKQDTGNTSLSSIDTKLTSLNFNTDTLETALGGLTETAPASDTASSGLNGRLQRVAQRLTSLIAQIPASLGVKARAASLSVALSTEDVALLPASLGSKAAAASFAVTGSTEDVARIGIVTETAPASDTASSGLNGRLQRIAQRITSLIALVPTSLGAKTAANSFAVTLATDDAIIGGTADAAATAGSTGSISAKLRAISRDLVANIVLAAGSNLIGRAVADASAATGGIASTSRIVSAAASTNATSAKASAGRVYAIQGYNAATSVRYLKIYNKASAPTVGSDTPVKTLALPPSCGFAFDWPNGYSFATGIAYALTTGSADADTGALTSGDVLGLNVDYV